MLGERFCVHWGYEGKAVKTGRGLRGIVLLDGIKVGGGLLPPESVRNCEELELTGHQQRGNVERPFIFRQREETGEYVNLVHNDLRVPIRTLPMKIPRQ